MRSIIVLDDEAALADTIAQFLEREGYDVEGFSRSRDALERLKQRPCDLLICDVNMPGLDGLEVLERARRIRPDCEVMMMTGFGSIELAVESLKRGAADFFTKPIELRERLLPAIRQILAPAHVSLPLEAASLRGGAATMGIVAESASMRDLVEKLPRIARSDASVLLHGESGTGKEVFADELHRLSPRSTKPMVRLNCAAIPEALFESELFGHRKGAFTGAERDREGLIAQAEGGSLFLDEIGELPLPMQAKLLRVLQDKQYRRVGENEPRSADFRLISATNRDLRELDRESRLRSDLYYRIAVIQLELPPLRERLDDFDPLCLAFARGLDPEHTPQFTPRCQERLRAYPFPGNVRELRNAIEHAIVLADGAPLDVEHLPVALQEFVPPACARAAAPSSSLERIEVESILRALARTDGNQTEAAALLGTTRRTLGYRIQKYGLQQQIAEQISPRTLAKVRSVTREAARWRSQGE